MILKLEERNNEWGIYNFIKKKKKKEKDFVLERGGKQKWVKDVKCA